MFNGKGLADGQISNSLVAIYTCPGGTVAYVKSLTLFNTSATQQTLFLYINRSGTPRKWKRFVMDENEHADALEGAQSVILEAGDTIEAITTTNAVVDYTLSGVEET